MKYIRFIYNKHLITKDELLDIADEIGIELFQFTKGIECEEFVFFYACIGNQNLASKFYKLMHDQHNVNITPAIVSREPEDELLDEEFIEWLPFE